MGSNEKREFRDLQYNIKQQNKHKTEKIHLSLMNIKTFILLVLVAFLFTAPALTEAKTLRSSSSVKSTYTEY